MSLYLPDGATDEQYTTNPDYKEEPEEDEAASMEAPEEGQIVFVHGGVAQYRDGKFYTGMEDPRWERQIQWPIEWWHPIDRDPGK